VIVTWQVHTIMILGLFAVGTVVGSFANVCIYRIPYEKSVIWPASHCPRCWSAIRAQDNIPILSWLALRGECRDCGLPIAARYPLIELLLGVLFAGVYVVDVIYGPALPWVGLPPSVPVRVAYHAILVTLLVISTFIDYDHTIIPDEITITGMLIGLALGTFFPDIRPVPAQAMSPWEGFKVGITGLVVGAGLTQFIRVMGTVTIGKLLGKGEAMGLGDVTLMAMIGSFLGWQAAVLTFFLGPFFGLAYALWKVLALVGKYLGRRKISRSDHEMPFGPYLSMAGLTMLFSWNWLWPAWAKKLFADLSEVSLFLLGTLWPLLPGWLKSVVEQLRVLFF
jgi:leader peptidase (prepilin peptidase)/N-methyltransferase